MDNWLKAAEGEVGTRAVVVDGLPIVRAVLLVAYVRCILRSPDDISDYKFIIITRLE